MTTTMNGQSQQDSDNRDTAPQTTGSTVPSKHVAGWAVVGCVVVIAGSALFTKIDPTWADPLQVGIAAGGLYLVVASLLWRWCRHRG
ncbi:hypothetical protein OG195_44380 (plasmid) [Streptomyces sp. NBC_01362]|uniref:hypothetical protein n=1 Tax=Streptomyces sp. NBC_01362 TaxID=2903839 RepID=UPI002E318CAC|nr:hypothetical protein [Streptomyces sp. NBC_01362]